MTRLDACMSRYWKWLLQVEPSNGSLAWCHTTDAFQLRRIIEMGCFDPRPCPFFKEDLLYFFYGRPAFRRGEGNPIGIAARSPVVFLLRTELLTDGRRLHPFDTGAFKCGRYKRWIHGGMQVEDFEMPCVSDAPGRHIASLFGSNDSYLRLRSSAPTFAFDGEYEVESLVSMLTDKDISTADDRRLAVELQVDKPVALNSKNMLAIILPDELQQAVFVRDFLAGSGDGIRLLTYHMTPLKRSDEYQALLEEHAISLNGATTTFE